ncbi:MAG: hypothetical protein RLZZ303_2271 [Candidatus Hydrogenedentota bacterium]|jgi:hypothetical protein
MANLRKGLPRLPFAALLFLTVVSVMQPASGTDKQQCLLNQVELLLPSDGARWYQSDGATGLSLSLLAATDCVYDTASVRFSVVQGGLAQPIGAPDTSTPYEARLDSFFPPAVGSSLQFLAEATPNSNGTQLARDEASVSILATSSADGTPDGLPDAPFTTLGNSGDRWLASVALPGQEDRVVTLMTTIAGNDSVALPEIVEVSLASPEISGQSVRFRFKRAMVAPGERAILMARIAPSLASLVGTEEAALFSREPSGRLRGQVQYIAVSVLVSTNAGSTYSEINPTRLASNPVEVLISGLELDPLREHTLARHPAQLGPLSNVLRLTSRTGAWQSVATQSVDVSAGTITASLVNIGVYAPYYIVDEDEFCPLGFCAPPSIIVELLSILALLVLNLVPGGVGGAESPCFIATAAYGTPLAADLDLLRGLRDSYLLSNPMGTALVDLYYRASPPLAGLIATHPLLAAITRLAIMAMLGIAAIPAFLVLPLSGLFIIYLISRPSEGWYRRMFGLY